MSKLLARVPGWVWWVSGGLAASTVLGSIVVLYRDGKALGLALVRRVDGVPLTLRTAAAFEAMRAAAAADGVALKLNSGFRSMTEQLALYAKYLAGGTLAAKPGYSNHQSGTSADIEVHSSTTSPEYRWLAANGRQFGFVNTGKDFSQVELWHWDLVA